MLPVDCILSVCVPGERKKGREGERERERGVRRKRKKRKR